MLLADILARDPNYITSFRYLSRDKKNPIVKVCFKLYKQLGIIDDNTLPESVALKCAFVGTQCVYNLLTTFHVGLLYQDYHLSSAYIILVFSCGVWNGASYYIEVFSKRYNLKFTDKTTDVASHAQQRQPPTESVSSEENDDRDDEDFVEALESLDLNEPQNLKLYTDLLEPLVEASTELSERDDPTPDSETLS